MGHYAKVVDGIVTKIIVAKKDYFDTFVDNEPGEWVKTSYNTFGGVHYVPGNNSDLSTPSESQEKSLRKNYAGIGYTYDKERDAFIPPKPEDSWILNEETCQWECPLPYPTDGKSYDWDDDLYKSDNTQGWILDKIQEGDVEE